jgi:hypothetical protein
VQTLALTGQGGPLRWAELRNTLRTELTGLENDLPATVAVVEATSAVNARVQDARIELENAIRENERGMYVHDLEGNALTTSGRRMAEDSLKTENEPDSE